MGFDLLGMRSDPEFAKRTYGDQLALTRYGIMQQMIADGARSQYNDAEIEDAAGKAALTYKPIFERTERNVALTDQDRSMFSTGYRAPQGSDEEVKWLLWLGEESRKGNEDAAKEAANWMLSRKLVNETLTGKIITAGIDAYEAVKDADRNWSIGYDRITTDKMSEYLASSMGREAGQAALARARGWGTAASIAENVALNYVFVGSYGAAQAGAAGSKVFTGGLFTKGLYAGARSTIEAMAPGAARTAAKAFASYGIEALGSASIDVLRDLPNLVQAGQLQGKKAFWNGLARDFGEGVAYDVLYGVAQDVVFLGLKPLAKVFFGKPFDLTAPGVLNDIQKAQGAGDYAKTTELLQQVLDGRISENMLRQTSPEIADDLLAVSGRLRKLEAKVPEMHDSDEFLEVWGKAAGYDVEKLGTGYALKRNGALVTTSATRGDAFSFITANPKIEITTDDLVKPFAGREDFKVTVQLKGRVDAQALSDDTLIGMTTAARDGISDSKTIHLAMSQLAHNYSGVETKEALSSFKTRVISEDSFVKRAANPQKMIADSPDVLYVPKTMSTPEVKNQFLSYATTYGQKKWNGFLNLGYEFNERSAVSPQGLSAAARRLPEGTIYADEAGGVTKWRLTYRSPDGQLVSSVLGSNEEAAAAVGKALVQNGSLTTDEIIEGVRATTGVRIGPEASEFGTNKWVARDTRGKIIAVGDSVESIFEQRPSLWPRLPDRLGPELYYLGKGQYEYRGAIATGPYSDLMRTMNSFGKPRVTSQWRIIESSSDGAVKIRASSGKKMLPKFAVSAEKLGFQTEFMNLKSAKEFLQNETRGWDAVKKIAAIRGYDVTQGPGRKIIVSALDGSGSTSLDDLSQVENFLQRAPMSETHKALFNAIDDDFDEVLVDSARKALENDFSVTGAQEAIDTLNRVQSRFRVDSVANFIDGRVAPAYSALERMSQRAGWGDIPVKARELNASLRASAAETFKASRLIRSIASPNGKLIDRNTSEVLGRVLSEGPENWASAAKTLGLELTPQHESILRSARAYYNRLGQVFGIDAWRYVQDYAPKIRDAAKALENEGLGNATKTQLLTRAFGPRWRDIPEVNFFARHTRYDAFLDATRNRLGLVDQMVHYTEDGYRELYLGSFQTKLAGWYQELSSRGLDASTENRVMAFFNDALHIGGRDGLGDEIAGMSYEVTNRIANGVRKLKNALPGLSEPIETLARNITTNDIAGKASAMVTHATLGFRPFRGISNMGQYMNTYAVFGDYAVRGARELDDATLEKMFRDGIIQEKVFATSAEGIMERSKLLEMGLKPQQQSEYLTRGWTAMAAGEAFDDAYKRLGAGVINGKQFLEESKVNFIDKSAQDAVLQHMRNGNPGAAKALFQSESIRLLMFDYAKENYPMMFRGTVGRAFGKFGVFPVGQIDLYRRILSSGSAADRVIRATRLVASSVLLYNAFREVGIDYSGFLWNDAFSFSGGPIFQSGLDVLNAFDTGPEGTMARKDLARSFLPGFDSDGNFTLPRLVVPGALEVNALIKAAGMADSDPRTAALTALGATTRKDWLHGGLRVW